MPIVYKIDVMKALEDAGYSNKVDWMKPIPLNGVTINLIERKRMVGIDQLENLCILLKCGPEDLLTWSDEEAEEKPSTKYIVDVEALSEIAMKYNMTFNYGHPPLDGIAESTKMRVWNGKPIGAPVMFKICRLYGAMPEKIGTLIEVSPKDRGYKPDLMYQAKVDNIKERMNSLGMTSVDLKYAAHINKTTLSDVMQLRRFRRQTFEKIATALDCAVEDIAESVPWRY